MGTVGLVTPAFKCVDNPPLRKESAGDMAIPAGLRGAAERQPM